MSLDAWRGAMPQTKSLEDAAARGKKSLPGIIACSRVAGTQPRLRTDVAWRIRPQNPRDDSWPMATTSSGSIYGDRPRRHARHSSCGIQFLDGRHRVNGIKAPIMVNDSSHEPGAAFQVVVMGTGPVGKTSLVNALLGRAVGEVGATMGTTRRGAGHTHVIEGHEGVLLLTDTPGLGEAGTEGWTASAKPSTWPRVPICWFLSSTMT